jgi:hypothetical protein
MDDEQIKHLVDRFLGWKLPSNFSPDAGISFKAEFNQHTDHPMKHEPMGTNLLDATQAEAMVRYMIEGLPDLLPHSVLEMQEEFRNPVHQVAFRGGFILCREVMARFVEQGGDHQTAASIRANWVPALGDDPGGPRRYDFAELVAADNMEEGPWVAKDVEASLEGAVYALCAMHQFGMELPGELPDSTS